jgi:hypothetical protein
MAVRKSGVKSHNKKLRRRLEGLTTKAYEYGELDGTQVALFISYPKRGTFYSYLSEQGLSWIHDVENMVMSRQRLPASQQGPGLAKNKQMSHSNAKNERPDDVKRRVEETRRKQKRASHSVKLDEDDGASEQEDEEAQEAAVSSAVAVAVAVTFPNPPTLELTIFKGRN